MEDSGFADVLGKTVTNTGGVPAGTPAAYGSAAAQFSANTGQYLDIAASSGMAFGGDFTIEARVFVTAAGDKTILSNYTGNTANCWMFLIDPAQKLTLYPAGGATNFKASVGMSTNAWHHVAACRTGTTITLYVDGVSVASGTQSGTFGDASIPVRVGLTRVNSWPFNGSIDEIRMTNLARYTGNFVPHPGPWPNQ